MIAKLLQSCPCLCDPTRLRCPWDSPGKNTGVGCHWWLLRLNMGWVLGQPPNVPSVSFLTTALWGNNYSHFTGEETESGRAIQVVRELVFAHQYIRLLSSTCNNFSRDFLIHWRERTSRMWRHVWQKVEDRALWHWGGVMTGLPQEGGEGQRLLSFLSFWHSNQLLYKVLIIRGYHLPHTIFFFFLGQEMPLLKASK